MNRLPSIVATIVKMMLGMLFLFSAASKYVSLDEFELYIYSFDLFSQGLCFLLARLVIAGELLLGIWLLSNRFHRWACLANTLLLVGMSIFLAYAALSGRQDNCHCFGEILQFDPTQSLLKNAVLLLLTLVAWRWGDGGWRPRWWVALLLVVPLVVLPFEALIGLGYLGRVQMIVMERDLLYSLIISLSIVYLLATMLRRLPVWLVVLMALTPFGVMAAISTAPEDWTRGEFRYPFDREVVRAHVHEGGALQEARTFDGRRVMAFYSLHCAHCRATAGKMNAVQHHNQLPDSVFVDVFMDVGEQPDSSGHRQILIQPNLFVTITRGQFPLVLLIDGDSIYQTFSTVVPEKEIVQFLENEK